MQKDLQAIFKFNSGAGALCCSSCNVIIKTAYQFSDEEMAAMKGEGELEAQYCDDCKCICAEYDGKGFSTCGVKCPVHYKEK